MIMIMKLLLRLKTIIFTSLITDINIIKIFRRHNVSREDIEDNQPIMKLKVKDKDSAEKK